MAYVSTAKWRERCWRFFPTFPESMPPFFVREALTFKQKDVGLLHFW